MLLSKHYKEPDDGDSVVSQLEGDEVVSSGDGEEEISVNPDEEEIIVGDEESVGGGGVSAKRPYFWSDTPACPYKFSSYSCRGEVLPDSYRPLKAFRV